MKILITLLMTIFLLSCQTDEQKLEKKFYEASVEAIKGRLLAPDEAIFAPIKECKFQGGYVTVPVKVKNAFGVMINSNYEVLLLEHEGNIEIISVRRLE